jgi:hypothetical protein
MEYYEGYYDGLRQRRMGLIRGLLFSYLFRTVITLIYLGIVYLPLLLISYGIADKFAQTYSNTFFVKIPLIFIIAYALYAVLYFLKGILIALKANRYKAWIPLLVFCVLVSCGLQVLVVQVQLQDFFYSRPAEPINNYKFWSWLGALAIGAVVYRHYKFLTNISPKSIFWAYDKGVKTGLSYSGAATPIVAKKSEELLYNAEMKVSYRR